VSCSARRWGALVPNGSVERGPVGVDGLGQEGEQGVAFASQVVQQPPVGWVDGLTGQQPVNGGPEPLGLGLDLGGVQLVGVARRPCRQGSLEDAADRARGLGLATLGVIQQLTAAAQQVRQAGLMGGAGEPAVGRHPSRSSTPA
jgi:hypothetical protein